MIFDKKKESGYLDNQRMESLSGVYALIEGTGGFDISPPVFFKPTTGMQQNPLVLQRVRTDPVFQDPGRYIYTCARCGLPISTENRITTVYRHSIHTFVNPAGVSYTILCFQSAPGVFLQGEPTTEYSWFSGCRWCYAHCIQCWCHLGWFFACQDRHFYGLILRNLRKMDGSVPEGT